MKTEKLEEYKAIISELQPFIEKYGITKLRRAISQVEKADKQKAKLLKQKEEIENQLKQL